MFRKALYECLGLVKGKYWSYGICRPEYLDLCRYFTYTMEIFIVQCPPHTNIMKVMNNR